MNSISTNFSFSRKTILLGSFFFILFALNFFPRSAGATVLQRAGNKLGMTGYWTFNDNAGSSTTDFSGRGNTGTLNNMEAADWVSGKIGPALLFDGTNEYVQVADSASIRFAADMTFSAWVYYDSRGTFNFIVEKGLNDDDNYAFYTDSSGHLVMEFQDSVNTYRSFTDSTGIVPLTTWTHVAIVYDDTNNLVKFYINGSQTANPATSFSLKGTQTTDLFIGRQNAASTFSFAGMIDEVRLYSRALSATEITALYNAGLIRINANQSSQLTSGLIALHSFDGTDLTTTNSTDRSGQGHTGTLVSTPVPTLGKIGQALNFNGTNYVTLAGSLNQSGGSYSVSTWINSHDLGSCATGGGDFCGIINAVTVGGAVTDDFWSGVTIFGKFEWVIVGSSSNSYQRVNTGAGGTEIVEGNWYHVVTVYNSSGPTYTIYINGVSQTLQSGSAGSPSTGNRIGAQNAGNPTYSFNGKIDDVRVYNRALSASEVVQLYELGKAHINSSINILDDATSNLVSWHTFDGPRLNTTTSTDSKTPANNGTLAGNSRPRIGKIGQALYFDGTGDFVTLTNESNFDFTSAITVSAWVKLNTTDPGHNQGILAKGRYNHAASPWALQYQPGELKVSFSNTVIVTSNYASDLLGNWQLLTFTFDKSLSSNQIKLYINAENVVNGTKTTDIVTSDDAVTIGTNLVNEDVAGYIDDVRIYNRALSNAEISQLYNAGR